MAMTKREFKLIAEVIDREIELSISEIEPHHVDAYCELAHKLSELFTQLNPRFDRELFIKASNADARLELDK